MIGGDKYHRRVVHIDFASKIDVVIVISIKNSKYASNKEYDKSRHNIVIKQFVYDEWINLFLISIIYKKYYIRVSWIDGKID